MATHKVGKGEKLEQIAKKYGHSDWKTVWNAAPNKALVAKRGKPESLQPGDILQIPPTAKELADVRKHLGHAELQRGYEIGLRDVLKKEIERLPKVLVMYDGMMTAQAEYTQQTIAELRSLVAKMKAVGEGVDMASTVLQLGVDLDKLRRMHKEALGLSGEALEKFNKEMAGQIKSIANSPLEDAATKALATLNEDAVAALAAVGIMADSWDKVQSPSFWAHSVAQMVGEGKSWSEAASSEVGDSIGERIDAATAGAKAQIKHWRERREARRARLAMYQLLLTACEARIKAWEAAASSARSQLK